MSNKIKLILIVLFGFALIFTPIVRAEEETIVVSNPTDNSPDINEGETNNLIIETSHEDESSVENLGTEGDINANLNNQAINNTNEGNNLESELSSSQYDSTISIEENNLQENNAENNTNSDLEPNLSTSEILDKLAEQIKNEDDLDKKKALQEDYNNTLEKYYQEVQDNSSEKLDKDVLKRFKDNERTSKFYEIQNKLEEYNKKKEDGTLTKKDVDDLNELLDTFKIPRLLNDEEKNILKDYNNIKYIPALDGADESWQKKFEQYQKLKQDLDKALNTEEDAISIDELKKLKEDFDKLNQEINDAINAGTIKAKLTNGNPEIYLFPFDFYGNMGDVLKEETYYIPDNAEINLLIQINKDRDNKEFTFTFEPIKDNENIGDINLKDLVFLNGNPVEFDKHDDGSYSFTVDGTNYFDVAQMKMNVKGFKGQFHKGFKIKMQAGTTELIKEFLITKKGYEDDADTTDLGSSDKKKPQLINAGNTENAIVDLNTNKVFDVFAYLKKSNVWIDDVMINSTSDESIPLSSVEISFKLPSSMGKVAEYIHNSGLEYYQDGDRIVLKLDSRVLGGNLKTEGEGENAKLYYEENGNKIYVNKANLSDIVLTKSDKKVYVDVDGNVHEVKSREYLSGDKFKIEANKLYIKSENTDEYNLIGEFKNNKIETDTNFFELIGNQLISYVKVYDVFDGNVTNKDDKADQFVTPTIDGKHVIIKNNTKDENGADIVKESYGGTIVENAIFDDSNKIFNNEEYTGESIAAIDETGKKVDNFDKTKIETIVENNKEKEIYKVDDKIYSVVRGSVFNSNGYIIGGLKFVDGLSMVDKYGRLYGDIVVTHTGDNYTFTKKTGDNSKTVNTSDEIIIQDGTVLVNSKNWIVKDDNNQYEAIVGKYYFDGSKFIKVDGNIIGDKYYQNLKQYILNKIVEEYYSKDNVDKKLSEDLRILNGSINPEDYFEANGKLYLKEKGTQGEYYVSMDEDGKISILSESEIYKVVQTLGNEEQIVDVDNLFDAVKNAKFKLRFPGFLAGKDVLYNLEATFKADYLEPANNEEYKKTSIFKDGEKTVVKYFTIENKKTGSSSFFKNPPAQLYEKPDYQLFNILYRDASDRVRDEIIKKLIKLEQESDSEVKKEANKESLDLLNKLQEELARLYDGAKFIIDENDNLAIVDKNGKTMDIERSIKWEIGFTNSGSQLFPEDADTIIVVEDYSLDNRLVYDEIIINDTKQNWNKDKSKWEESEKNKKDNDENYKIIEFKGSEEYFFLDQINNIIFGINPHYTKGQFISVGKKYVIKKSEIIDALNNNKSITKDGIEYSVTKDSDTGQIRIKVLNAFYKKVENVDTHKFESPVQKDYENMIRNALNELENLDTSSKENAKKSIDKIVLAFHSKETKCNGIITEQFKKLIDSIDAEDDTKIKEQLNTIKESLKASLDGLKLAYIDSGKTEYYNNDFRFNAIRLELEPGLLIGGAIEPTRTKKFAVTTVIIPEVDIPYTDEFGNILTNKDMYINAEINKILKTVKDDGTKYDLKNELDFITVYKKAYEKVNKDINSGKIIIKNLAKFNESTKEYNIVKGSELSYNDLAIDGNSLKDPKNKTIPINGYYIGEGEDAISIAEKINDVKLKESKAYKLIENQEINLIGYYMNSNGYNRAFYGNKANYKLLTDGEGKTLFNNLDSWKKTICYPGLGHCITIAGSEIDQNEINSDDENLSNGGTENKITLDYDLSTPSTDSENPKVDKNSNRPKVDLRDTDKTIDFEIDITVDKLNKDQKKLKDAIDINVKDEEEFNELDYNENGFYLYKKALIIDILPDIFTLTEDSKITLDIDKIALQANGANKDINIDDFKSQVEYLYVDDVLNYLEKLKATDSDKAVVLEKALSGKLKSGVKQQAILAWLPEFEAPHGSTKQFTLKLTSLNIDEKQYKEYADSKNLGVDYVNEAAFGNNASFIYGSTTIRINKHHESNVNKYLQLIDEAGNIIDADKADGWFKGNAIVKFGDKFNYKISYFYDSGIIENPYANTTNYSWSIDDLFAEVKDNGLKPVLRDYITEPDGFEIIYKVGENSYSKDELINLNIDLAKVTGITMKVGKQGFKDKTTVDFILPMMIPSIDAKIVDGKVFYIGVDGNKKELGDAKDFFDLEDFNNKVLYANNTVENSNTVTVYLDKTRIIKILKEFVDSEGKQIKDNLPEVKFDVYQITVDEEGNSKKIKLDEQIVLNETNGFFDGLSNLPIKKYTKSIDENGNIIIKEIEYAYEVSEVASGNYNVQILELTESDELGFIVKAINTENPEQPEEPGTPPEEPNKPEEPGTPPEEPNKPNNPKDNEPSEPEKEQNHKEESKEEFDESEDEVGDEGINRIPKTGTRQDLSLLLSGIMLIVLLFFRKKFFN